MEEEDGTASVGKIRPTYIGQSPLPGHHLFVTHALLSINEHA